MKAAIGGLIVAGPLLGIPAADAQETSPPEPLRVSAGELTLTVRPQTPEEAYDFLGGVLSEMAFFRENGYEVALPDHPEFDGSGALGSFETFRRAVYDPAAFEAAMEVMRRGEPVLRSAVDWFDALPASPGLRVYEDYVVTITQYGPGGSYDPRTGGIVLLANENGEFKGGGGAHTIAHEMMHLAVEDGIVQRYGLAHWEKERLVDLLTQQAFRDVLPDYRLQPQGVADIDPYVRGVPLGQLAQSVEAYAAARGD